MTSNGRRTDVDATSLRRIDFSLSIRRYLPTGLFRLNPIPIRNSCTDNYEWLTVHFRVAVVLQIYSSELLLSSVHHRAGLEVIKLFSCSTQLSMNFKMLLSIKILRNSAFFQTQIC